MLFETYSPLPLAPKLSLPRKYFTYYAAAIESYDRHTNRNLDQTKMKNY
jgi:hypothetical protein